MGMAKVRGEGDAGGGRCGGGRSGCGVGKCWPCRGVGGRGRGGSGCFGRGVWVELAGDALGRWIRCERGGRRQRHKDVFVLGVLRRMRPTCGVVGVVGGGVGGGGCRDAGDGHEGLLDVGSRWGRATLRIHIRPRCAIVGHVRSVRPPRILGSIRGIITAAVMTVFAHRSGLAPQTCQSKRRGGNCDLHRPRAAMLALTPLSRKQSCAGRKDLP